FVLCTRLCPHLCLLSCCVCDQHLHLLVKKEHKTHSTLYIELDMTVHIWRCINEEIPTFSTYSFHRDVAQYTQFLLDIRTFSTYSFHRDVAQYTQFLLDIRSDADIFGRVCSTNRVDL